MAVLRKTQSGFTLTEVLVAMVILSTAIAGAMVLTSQHVRAAADIEARLMADIVADNILVEALSTPQVPDIAVRRGEMDMGGSTWQWERRVEETNLPAMLRVTVIVRRHDSEQSLREVSAFRRVG